MDNLTLCTTTLDDVLEWLENDGFIGSVHYDNESIIVQIKATLGMVKLENIEKYAGTTRTGDLDPE